MTTSEAFWFGRFQVSRSSDSLIFRDALIPGCRVLPLNRFSGQEGAQRTLSYFQYGFLPSAASLCSAEVSDGPEHDQAPMFWQFPCITEKAAWLNHLKQPNAVRTPGALNIYLGLPWATWIDLYRKTGWDGNVRQRIQMQVRILAVRLSGYRHALSTLGYQLRVHTVCQHIYWRDMLQIWRQLGVTDAWVSHCTPELQDSFVEGVHLHPWALYAVNAEDSDRQEGLVVGRPPAEKPVLASFVGAHAPHYLSDIRLQLAPLNNEPDCVVKVTDKWHFEDVVYQHQISGADLSAAYRLDESVTDYNRLLSDSVFALCPSGAGPNTLRLWEALAVGAVPVLLGEVPALPDGGSLSSIDWDAIILRYPHSSLEGLPSWLRAIPMQEVVKRQTKGLEAYQQVKAQSCFNWSAGSHE
ncbi:exostosin family protein [Gilvimarinus sp. SDUM040013]|uniref:Exostosin family protein n=1 Tax=Gilvimarinus gilvus TaxID=3058038 RepID=A0ABU4S1D3_9GAMM|nr:exostosin family protein [Gilvimarinus sp. SDUM040013]MDO3387350.1 exostosin family protein [Gilvimarinus sp. SDUM040013]MDX6849039.1 exostosin family protein [Gilvimarinus sp. SDUM040013]